MKKIILSIISIGIGLSVYAQDELDEQAKHEITINVGGGLSTLKYDLESGKNTLGFGGSLGVGYTYFFNEQLGLGTGVEANFYQSGYSNDALTGSYRGIDPQNPAPDFFQLNYQFNEKYEEKQNALFLQIPLMLQFQTKGTHKFYAAAGGRVGIPVTSKFKTDASALTVTGFYSHEGGSPYNNLPKHGFTDYDSPKADGKLSLKTAYMASLELGVKWGLNENTSLYTGIYGDYGLNNIQKTSNKGVVTYNHNGTTAQGPSQDFLAYNNSITSTSIVEKITPMTFGVKVRFAFGLSKSKKATQTPIRYADEIPTTAEDRARRALDAAAEEKARLKRESDMEILMEPVYGFDLTKTFLTVEMMRILDKKIPILKAYPEVKLVCEGHTCSIGTISVNEKLGNERAHAVKDYLMRNGIAGNRLSAISRGMSDYVVPNDTEENRKRNRRVEFVVKQ